ncbi:dioxygenase [Pukyongiella litopenaei]|uniref:Hydroxyquinol 1,2-dioxygenase n=1 Tax=Pukyongiella litopenaei TaxID=2605946 RepID=A0A2S0MNM0_9RHOB|nr:dioxygenase [Pukyongiella litopenaei]AVO37489.1 hydroxyquinol 1,2-dioxygenase [Pukyongiella litopenaei]
MRNITIDNITEAVTGAMKKDIPDRNREIMTAAIKHFHAFAKEVNLTHGEWLEGCEWMRRAGEISNDARNEFILICDILGVEVLVDMLDNKVTEGESESTVLGPFYRENPPVLPKGASIVQKDFDGQQTVRVSGRVVDTDGQPIPGVQIDVWEDAPNGLYEQQDPDQPEYNLRGRFLTEDDGSYEFVGLRPEPYPIPYDGAAGELLNFMGHHPMRPGHIHFMISRDGYNPLISQIYDSETEYLDNDSVFAVKESLIGEMKPAPAGADTDLVMTFDFRLKAEASAQSVAAE